MQHKLIGFFIVAILAAIIVPIVVTQLGEGRQPTVTDSFTAVGDAITIEVVQLTQFPVVVDSEVVTVNAVPIAKPAQYTIVEATGVVTLAAASSDVGDAIVVVYNWQQLTGSVDTIWLLLPLIAVVGVLFVFLRRMGLMSGSKET